ncbi:Predicted ATPase [Amycolatopsis arida]|uniref:Predicted ATPase n=2 Tax=Amycolatopsis arida TaxID=587909 RepID=A0A1I5QEV7_9PSEU|nr:putative ATPase [Amycolatopsis arida]SFP44520.1 Predicted ATPase [Amycolatopsis arida]
MLGPLEVHTDAGTPVRLAGARLRALLIALALDPGRVVPAARLVDAIWGDHPPAAAANALQALVSRLRRALPDAAVESHPAGYRLAVDPDAVDVTRFERLVAAGRDALATDPAEAAETLRAALALWRGPALLDVAEAEPFRAPVARLTELRLAAVEDRVEADLRLGRGAELTTELAQLVAEHPLRERLVGALMRALCAAGRPAEALGAYERARSALAEALGTDPSPELSALHTAVLRGELPATSPPHDTWDSLPRTNLRAGLTSFVGRDADVVLVGKLVGDHRLTTLTGPGGAGKTRLATEVARRLLDQSPDGVWLVELAPVTGAADVPQAVLAALSLRDQALPGLARSADPVDRLVAALRARNLVLVLDNCEHLVDAVAALVDRLLGECPRLRVLATSREPLNLTGEALWPVEPLALPAADAEVAEALSSAAVRLLADRAVATRPGFTVTPGNLPAVVRICRALDGMPLAIELAAARLRTLSPEQLAGRLTDRFRLLAGGSRMALPRHRTLRAVVDWSWDLLTEPERVLLRRLAVFAGGASLAAVERVCAGGPVAAADVLDLLTALVDKSLLVPDEANSKADDGPRYRMLETIKEYGLERLAEAGESAVIRRAHAEFFAELVEAADPHLRRAEQLLWLDRLDVEHDNINAATRGAIDAGDTRAAIRLVAGAGWYWWLGGHRAEGAELAERALAMPGAADAGARATAYAIAALFATAGLGDEREVATLLEEAHRMAGEAEPHNPLLRFLDMLKELVRGSVAGTEPPPDLLDTLLSDEDPWVRAQARLNRARMLLNVGRARALAEADTELALRDFRALGERWGISFALTTLADLVAQRGDLAAAHELYREAVAVVTEVGAVEDVPFMRARQAQLQWVLGDPEGSAAALRAAERDAERVGWPDAVAGVALAGAELSRWAGDPRVAWSALAHAEEAMREIVVHPAFRAMLLGSRGQLAAAEGDLPTARAHLAEALDLAVNSRHAPTVAQVLVGVADSALRQGRPDDAARLLAASVAVRGAPDLSNPDATRVAGAARAALGDAEFTEAARSGDGATMATVRELAAPDLAG